MSFEPEKEKKAPPAPPKIPAKEIEYVTCTFQGSYYRAASKGLEKAHYREEVKVPLRLVRDPNRSAIGVFRDIIGPRVLRANDGFSGVAFCELVASSGLPDDLPLYKKIDYTGTHSELTKLAKTHTPDVKCGLYITPGKLKHNIKLCLQDPVAFRDLQDKLEPSLIDDSLMAEELEALGYN